MQTRSAARRLTDLIGDAYGFADLDEFRPGVLALLRGAVVADNASYNEVELDPAKLWVLTDPLMAVPRQEYVTRFAQLAHENPVLAHTRRTGDGRPRRISDFLDRDAFHATSLYAEVYAHVGVETQVAFTLPSRPEVVIGLALSRGGEHPDFSDEDVSLLALARPHLIQAYRTAELATMRSATIAALEAGLESIGAAVLVADASGRVAMATPGARSALGELIGRGDRLSRPLVERLADRRRAEAPPTEPLVLDDSLSVRVLHGPDDATDLLIFEPGAGGLDLGALRGLGLTPREAETLRWVALGRRGPDVARAMGISPRTVEKHLQRVYAKLGVRSASEAATTAWAAVGLRRPG